MATGTTRALPAPSRPAWARPSRRTHWWRPATTPHAALAALLFAAYALVSALRYRQHASSSWDLAIFTQAVKAYAHARTPITPIKGEDFNILGDHTSPITATLAPLWHLWPSPLLLLTAQAALLAWSAAVVSDTAARHLGHTRGLCIGTAYGLSFGLLRAIDVDFHETSFAAPLLAVVGRQLLARRWHRAAYWALPLLLVKEDLGLTVATIGLLITIQGRRWITGPLLVAAGLAATAAAIWWLIPHFNHAGTYAYWDKAPHGWQQALWQPISRLQTWKTIGWTLGITGFLAARSPLLLLTAPTLGWRLLSTNPVYWGTDWHYSAVLMPVAFLAATDAATRHRDSRRLTLRALTDRTVTALPAVALACMCALGYGPAELTRPQAWTTGPITQARNAALATIPDGARVEATTAVLAPLAARTDTYWYGGSHTRLPDYIVMDRHDWTEAPKPEDAAAAGAALHPGAQYEVVFSREDITVLRLTP
ncbi:DUF2079 domain-containing protein [Kitasatospora camelliae]|uniref:DUF2079 domain-containing protein n=1 Tax=Kitasatospora camelliae TaxID=3156397 RepID=A0AAU8K4K0_9ACTN